MKVYNATRHDQRPRAAQWRRVGFVFVPTPGPGMNSVPPQASPEELLGEARETVAKATFAGAEGVVIGGISSLAAMVAIQALRKGLRVIEPVYSGKREGVPVLVGVRDMTRALELAAGLQLTKGDGNAPAT